MEKILKYTIFAITGLFAVALIAQLLTSFLYPRYYGYGGMMGSYGMGFGMLGGTLFLIIFIVIIVALLEQSGTRTRTDALELLNRRYAGGEIAREEYLERKKDLETG